MTAPTPEAIGRTGPIVPTLDRRRLRAPAIHLDRSTAAMAGVGLLAAVAYLWNLSINGFANTYYAAAALAAAQSWSAWFFGALDAGGFITVDKPPLSTMLMGLSVRVFGLSSWSLLVPEALLGVGAVLLLFVTVRRQLGTAAATTAGVALALTPVAALVFRFDNPEALLTFLLVASAYATQRAIERGAHRWLIVAGIATGLAFLTKYLQGFLVAPALVLAYAVAADASVRRRIAGVITFSAATLLTAGAWVAAVMLTPVADRPWIGGSETNSVLDLILGYDGLGRLLGASSGSSGGVNFSGAPGLLRLFNAELGGQIAWLLPFAGIALLVGLAVTLRRPRTDLRRAAYLLWGGWLVLSGAVLSLMSGGSHPYYVAVMAPAVAALTGLGVVELWQLRERRLIGGILLAGAVLASVSLSYLLLSRTPDFLPWLAPAVLILGFASAPFLAVPGLGGRRLGRALVTASLVAMLAGPVAYSLQTIGTSQQGSMATAGPTATVTDLLSGDASGGMGGRLAGGMPGGGTPPTGGTPSSDGTSGLPGTPPTGSAPTGTMGGAMGGPGGASVSDELIAYLEANQGDAAWIVAVSDAQTAASIELATGLPVMATGGFTGSDPALSLDRLKALVAEGKLRYFVVGGRMGGPGGDAGTSSEVSDWVTANGTAITVGGTTLYDLSGAATA
ncbi:MAG: glycosyltransferase family 39 protein [Thermoleophilia bacterium]